eukprot:COSAG03_NODE_3964_length_1737_cov_8.893162_1_plen_68_part_10
MSVSVCLVCLWLLSLSFSLSLSLLSNTSIGWDRYTPFSLDAEMLYAGLPPHPCTEHLRGGREKDRIDS